MIEWQAGLTFDVAEKQILESALKKHDYNIKATALALGVCRSSVYKKAIDYFGKSIMDLKKEKEALPSGV